MEDALPHGVRYRAERCKTHVGSLPAAMPVVWGRRASARDPAFGRDDIVALLRDGRGSQKEE
jgi:hypothetical protein